MMGSTSQDKKKENKLNKHVDKIKDNSKSKVIKLKKNGNSKKDTRGVIYLGHIPHGFYEDAIRDYCSQFGKVTRVRVARSKYSGRCKGYAFVEFLHDEVAKVVAETLNNYLMFNRLLKCSYVPVEKRHRRIFISTITETNFPKQRKQQQNTLLKNASKSAEAERKNIKRRVRKLRHYDQFLQSHGINLDIEVKDPLNIFRKNEDGKEVVVEIDESDDEVQCKTPPNAKKIFKRASMGTPSVSASKIIKSKRKRIIKGRKVK